MFPHGDVSCWISVNGGRFMAVCYLMLERDLTNTTLTGVPAMVSSPKCNYP